MGNITSNIHCIPVPIFSTISTSSREKFLNYTEKIIQKKREKILNRLFKDYYNGKLIDLKIIKDDVVLNYFLDIVKDWALLDKNMEKCLYFFSLNNTEMLLINSRKDYSFIENSYLDLFYKLLSKYFKNNSSLSIDKKDLQNLTILETDIYREYLNLKKY